MKQALVCLLLLALPSIPAQQAGTAVPRTPVLVELFTSEGCSTCPPADQFMVQLNRRQPVANAQVVVLGLHVDYWDRAGWRDRFSDPRFTQRQQAYAAQFHQEPYTPQIIVDGSTIAENGALAVRTIEESATRNKPVQVLMARSGDSIELTLQGALATKTDAYLAIVEDDLQTTVKGGENQGRELRHAAVVRELRLLGHPSAVDWRITVPLKISSGVNRNNARTVVFLQDKRTGRVLGIGVLDLSANPR